MCSHDQTRSQVWGEEPGGEEPSPRRQGCCRPCDLVLRLTLTPRPRSCWPRILHVWLLSAPNSVLFAGKLPGTAPSWRQGGGHPSWRAEGPRESLGSLLPGAGLFAPLVDHRSCFTWLWTMDVCTLLSKPAPCPSFCCSAVHTQPSGAPPPGSMDLLKVTRGEASPQPLQGSHGTPRCRQVPPAQPAASGHLGRPRPPGGWPQKRVR